MRILFFVHTLGRTRHFQGVIERLTDRQHAVVLAIARQRETPTQKGGFYGHPLIRVAACPVARDDRWAVSLDAFRRARDYLRYFDSRYAAATQLAARAADHTPRGWTRAVERHPWMRRHWRVLQRGLAAAEHAVPADREFLRFVQDQAPDLILVTPLVDFGSYQTDYVKAAHTLGVPVCYLPFSWDNLTNRGLVRVAPDRVLVWNADQQQEANELHGVPRDRIVVTGAPRFDEFFAMKPATSRASFCGRLRLDPSRPLLLYLCSASFIAPQEVAFVRRWIAALREGSSPPWLKEASVLIRPHPANQTEWESTDLSDLPAVAVWTKRGTLNADQNLYDSIFHAAAVVGLNTSAMIEAAIIGRPSYTVVTPEFAGGQGGTLHFWYLLVENGGVVSMSNSFDEHVRQLSHAPDETDIVKARSLRFLAHFVRPRGLEQPAAEIMAAEIEIAGAIAKKPRGAAAWHYPVRWVLDAALHLGFDPTLGRRREART